MIRVADNIHNIVEQIHEIEQRYDRPEGSVSLLAVSKKQPVDKILQANSAGIRNFGENYLQEAENKIKQLDGKDICWHFIGPLQSNKTRPIANLFNWVQSVDRLKTAQRLSIQRDPQLGPLNVCIQVNLSAEQTKSGVSIDAVPELCTQVEALPNLTLRGLMAIPAPVDDFNQQRQQFKALANLFRQLTSNYAHFDTLSMGMSGDFEAAIAEGSTMVRIGTALFGSRI